MEGIELKEFQEKCSDFLIEKTFSSNKKGIIVKSPTGSGKTIILIDYIDKLLDKNSNLIVLWFCPGYGDLEEQSKIKMESFLPNKTTKDLTDVLVGGFSGGDTVFINWEQINKKNNKAITESEKVNLYNRRDKAIREGLQFIVIIDEEHRNKKSGEDVIVAFNAYYTVRVSATTVKNNKYDWYEINEVDVINEQLITKALYINEGVEASRVENEHKLLLELADKKRKAIKKEYSALGLEINPLVVIQFPDKSNELITSVEEMLKDMSYTYDNKLVSKWMSDSKDKINLNNITKNNAQQQFILIKQAVATGWDCPRAKILVKLREHMNEDFQVQTIGRIRRMPEAKHYGKELLDNCFLYTFDEDFQSHVKQTLSNAFDCKHIYLKDKCKTFTITTENRDNDIGEVNIKEAYDAVFNYYKKRHGITNVTKNNKTILEVLGYDLSKEIRTNVRQGKVILTERLSDVENTIITTRNVNTSVDGLLLQQTTNMLKSVLHCNYETTSKILKKLFRKTNNGGKIIRLNTQEYYAFIINNKDILRHHFREATADLETQLKAVFTKKTSTLKLLEEDTLLYDASIKDVTEMLNNAYRDYTDNCLVTKIRSKPERLFERYCEKNETVEWLYKNGDKGQEYFSIVYYKGLVQALFYPDYIVKLKNGDIWIIEIKGGEDESGNDGNIDDFSSQKFSALAEYAETYKVNWGFVRNKIVKDEEVLFINNTQYTDDMGEEWKQLKTNAF